MKRRLLNCAGFVRKTLLIVLVLFAAGLVFYGGELLDLMRFYQGIDAQVAMAQERGEKAHALAQSCVTCHGFDGNNLSSLYPSLAGLPADYLVAQLEAFAAGTRDEPMMGPLAKSLGVEEIRLLADYYAARAVRANEYRVFDAERVEQAKSLVAACAACHGAQLQGESTREPKTPRLAGQGEDYLVRQLQDYRSGQRIDLGGTMNAMAQSLSDEDIALLAYALSNM